MPIFSHPKFDDHEQVMYCRDAAAGLFGIIAVHSTALGPAAGGCRMYPYASESDALTDVLRLSRGMSYKNAMANLPLGGGKCVIIADPSRPDKANLLRAFSHHVQALGGRYWTAIDVGVGPEDADVLAENCDYIFARQSVSRRLRPISVHSVRWLYRHQSRRRAWLEPDRPDRLSGRHPGPGRNGSRFGQTTPRGWSGIGCGGCQG
jgi:hypothetical protein